MNTIIDDLPKTIPNSHVISSKGCTLAVQTICISLRQATGSWASDMQKRCFRCSVIRAQNINNLCLCGVFALRGGNRHSRARHIESP